MTLSRKSFSMNRSRLRLAQKRAKALGFKNFSAYVNSLVEKDRANSRN